MSIKESLSPNNSKKAAVKVDDPSKVKRRRTDRCFSFMEVSIEPGKSLKDLDSNKFKAEIKRWAKAVVTYARQVSGRLSRSGRSGSSTDSPQDSGSLK